MHLIEIIKKNFLVYSLLIAFVGLFFVTRVPRLWNDTINPDGVNWHFRSEQFVVALKQQNWVKTYQHYHPGVTLMWLSGSAVELAKRFTGQPIYSNYTYPLFDFTAKYVLIVAQLILSIIALYVLANLFGFYKSYAVISLFTFEPFFIGNSRLFHLDVLLSLFVLCALLLGFKAFSTTKVQTRLVLLVTAGFFLAMSFLTKSIGVVFFVYMLLYSLWIGLLAKNLKRAFVDFGVLLCSGLVFTVLTLPAMWVKPIFYMKEIFREAERIGVREGHAQIVLGEDTLNAPPQFYLLVLLIKFSPVIILGLCLGLGFGVLRLVSNQKDSIKELFNLGNLNNIFGNFGVYMFFAFVPYMLVMLLSSKKIDRYLLPLFPLMAYYAYLGFLHAFKSLEKLKSFKPIFSYVVFALLLCCFVVYPNIKLFPYQFAYSSPIFINGVVANTFVSQKPFGVGIYDVLSVVRQRYGNVVMGFYDVKPMKALYTSSKVLDVRVYGPGQYDILILAVNETMPEKVLNSTIAFKLDYVIKINDLDYWRIYVKDSK